MEALTAAGAGFLLAVLWFDLMFDVQVRGDAGPEAVRSIARYYRRVTTDARPMNRLVPAAMLVTLGALVAEAVTAARGHAPWWPVVALPLALAPILLAGLRTVPSAVRLGASAEVGAAELATARTILADHIACFACIGAVVVVQIAAALA